MLVLLGRERLFTRASFPVWRWIRVGSPYLFKVAGPAFGTSFLWQSGYLVLFAITASLPFNSVSALAGLATGFRVEAILFLPAVAFNMTASVLVGHALGEGNPREAKRIILTILGVACAGMSVVGILLWPWRMELAGLLAPDPTVQFETAKYLTFNILAVPFTVASVVLAGSLNGAGRRSTPAQFQHRHMVRSSARGLLLGHIVWQDASRRLRRPCSYPKSSCPQVCSGWYCAATGRASPCRPDLPITDVIKESKESAMLNTEYSPIDLKDASIYAPYLEKTPERVADYTFTNLVGRGRALRP